MQNLFTFLLVLVGWSALGQTNTYVTVYNLSDTSKIAGVEVEIDFISQNLKTLKGITDDNGTVLFSLPASAGFYLIINKAGFKPIFTTLKNPSAQLDIYLKPLSYDGEEVTVFAFGGTRF